MYSLIAHLAVVGLTFVPVSPARELSPLGCRNSKTTADLLELLASRDWNRWTREELADAWPGFLHLHECEPKDEECGLFVTCHCDRLISQDRVIGGDCECCDLFFFDIHMDGGRVSHERLDIAILHHAVATKAVAEADAKLFVGAIGFDETASEHERFGESQSVQGHYQWPTGIKGVVNNVELSLHEVSEGWTIFLYWTRSAIPAQ